MTEETQDQPVEVPDPPSNSTLPSHALRKDIAAALAGTGAKVREMVVSELVTEEISKRKAAVLKVLAKIDEKQKEGKKIENSGITSFGLDGKPTGAPTFTKQQLDDLKKVNEVITKLQKALDDAFTNSDFSKLNNLANS